MKFLLPSALVLAAGAMIAPLTQVAAADPAPNGQALFAQRCQACHTVVAGQRGVLAPNLAGVTGRKAASVAQFNYSPALKASNVTWTRANLDRFLQGPGAMVPGTRMVITVANPQERAAILSFLATKR
ncbi:MAG: c-type cytochrome [Sphingomonadales bacterium]|nr:c-type cytochrome [Sphingomonadales bacterium]